MAQIIESFSTSSNTTSGSQLDPGQKLQLQQSIFSPDGSVEFRLQRDGKIAIYQGQDNCVWQNTADQRYDIAYCTMDNGVLKLITKDGKEAWASPSPAGQYNFLAVQDDGNVVIYAPTWATGSNKK